MVKVELFDDLDAVERDAAGALDRAAQRCLHARLSWFRLLHRHDVAPPGTLRVARARNGTASAWLFLAQDGRRAQSYAAWYSLRSGLIGAERLASDLAATLKRQAARVELGPLAAPEPLAGAFRAAGWATRLEPAAGNWVAHTAGLSFDDYWAKRPGKLRSTAQRKAKAAALDIAIHDCFDPGIWAEYEAVYRASWKPEEGSFPFLRALAEQEGAAGTLRLGIARKDGRPVAAQMWIVEDGIATIHKLAYAEDAKALSPGTILGAAMFRRAIDEDRVREIDYGTGDDAYKRDWMDERRQLWRLVADNPATLQGLAGLFRHRIAALVTRLRSR